MTSFIVIISFFVKNITCGGALRGNLLPRTASTGQIAPFAVAKAHCLFATNGSKNIPLFLKKEGGFGGREKLFFP